MGCLRRRERGEQRLEEVVVQMVVVIVDEKEEVLVEEHSYRFWASNWWRSCAAQVCTHTDRYASVQLRETVLEWSPKEPVALVLGESQSCFRSYSREWPEQ